MPKTIIIKDVKTASLFLALLNNGDIKIIKTTNPSGTTIKRYETTTNSAIVIVL